MSRFFRIVVVALLLLVGVGRNAFADVLQAPIGGKAITLGEGRVACGPLHGGWQLEAGGRAVRPPTVTSAIGSATDIKIATAAENCEKADQVVTLVATGTWPTFDKASITLSADEGRLEARGRRLRGAQVAWVSDGGFVADACSAPKIDSTGERCTWAVPKTLATAAGADVLRWLPAGALAVHDAIFFGADGEREPLETFSISPSRIEIAQIIPSDVSADVSSGLAILPLTHPDAIADAECGALRCTIENGVVQFQPPSASTTAIDIRFRLAPHVVFTGKGESTTPVVRVSILRCPMSVASGPFLRNVDGARAVIKLGGACANSIGSLHFFVGSRQVDAIQILSAKESAYAVLDIGAVDAPTLAITVERGEADSNVVAVARIDTRAPPKVRAVLELAGFPPIDFIPNNQGAVVHVPRVPGATLVLLPHDNIYEVKTAGDVTKVQGDVNAAGVVALLFGYRIPALPPPLDQIDLAVLSDSLQRPIKEANIPAPVGPTAFTNEPLVEVVCTGPDNRPKRIEPGITTHLPFSVRDSCRVILHRERLSPEYGTQKLSLEIEVLALDGSVRSAAHFTQSIVMRSGAESRIFWVKGVRSQYDRIVIRVSHVADEAHYLGALEIMSGAPAAQWNVVLGTGRFRLYATSAIPTGLYRFGEAGASGVMSLSFGIISRLTWLDTDGHEGLLGLEAGVMAFGLTGDTSTAGKPLTQVGAVIGLGMAIPIADAGGRAQASINLHAWFEQRLTGSGGLESKSARAIIFGPSISFGNIGTTF